MDKGFIVLHRKLLDSPMWQTTTPEQSKILITLLLMANHKEKKWIWQGKEFVCQPGQIITSLPSIKKACGNRISEQNIRTALKKFESWDFLTDKSTKQNRLITIVNWRKYQDKEEVVNGRTNRQLTDDQQTVNRQLTANNNDKQCNNENNSIPSLEKMFDEFWEAYPKKRSKGNALKAFKQIRPDAALLAKMLEKIELCKKTVEWQKEDGQYIPYPGTWLRAKGWEDVIDVKHYKDEEW